MESVKDRLQKLMISRGITQADISRDTGISKASISSYLSGRKNPKQDKIYKIATRYQVDPAWLSGFDVPMESSAKMPVKKYREQIGMTQEELGLMLNPHLTKDTIISWENGAYISPDYLIQLSDLFSVPAAALQVTIEIEDVYSRLNDSSREKLLKYAKVLQQLQRGDGPNETT